MRFFVTFILITFAACGCVNNRQEMKLPLGDGDYLFVHKFAEAEQHRIKSITLNVIIKGMHVTVINNDRDDVFPKGILEEGTLIWHSESEQWSIGQNLSDAKAPDIGGCSEGPTVIDVVKRIYWTC